MANKIPFNLSRLNLRHNFPLLVSLFVVTAAIPLTVFVALTQNAENRSRADTIVTPPSYPLVEFGTIGKSEIITSPINGVGSPNPPPNNQIGSTPSAINCDPIPTNCRTSPDGAVACTGWVVVPPDHWCLPPTAPITMTNYYLNTKDSRSYLLDQYPQTIPSCVGTQCPKSPSMPVRQINFDQYLGQIVMIEGILGQKDQLQLWTQPPPLPLMGKIFVKNVHPAQLTQSGISLVSYLNAPYSSFYNDENVFYLDQNPPNLQPPQPTNYPYPIADLRISEPVKPETFVTSPYYALDKYLGTKINIAGDLYLVDGIDKFFNAVGPIAPLTTPTPTPSSCGIFGINICPAWAPPRPGWCDGGQVVAGQTDSCGCQMPPTCITPIPTTIPAARASLSFDPTSLDVSINSPFTSQLTINTYNNRVSAIDIDLQFDPQTISLTTLSPTSYLPRVLASSTINNTAGQAHIALGIEPTKPVLGDNVPVLIITGKTKNTDISSVVRVLDTSSISVMGFSNNAFYGTPTLGITIKKPLLGDLDGNGVVDIFDYNTMVTNFGKTNCGNPADTDGNCKVDIFDYNNLVTNFGKRATPTPTPFITTTPSPTPTTNDCQALWWFDNNNRYCSNMTFCGNYQYSGLQTFTTQLACQSALSVSNVTPTPTPTISPTPTPTITQVLQPHITSIDPTTIYMNMDPRSARLQIHGSGFLSGTNFNAGPIYRSLYLQDYRGVTRYIKEVTSTNEITYPSWTDSYIDTGTFYPAQIIDIHGGGGTPFAYQPVKVYVEIYDYSGPNGRRTLGISNPVYITIK